MHADEDRPRKRKKVWQCNGTEETEQASGSCVGNLQKTLSIHSQAAKQSPCQERQLIEQSGCQCYLWGELDGRKRLQDICANSK